MRLTKRLATIGTATMAAVVLGAGGAHAQGDGGLLSLLGHPSIVLACFPAGQVGHGNTFNGTQNINCSQSATATTTNPPAENGFTGYQVVPSTIQFVQADTKTAQDVLCPGGKRVLGGGVTAISGSRFDLNLLESGPLPDGTGWSTTVEGTGGVVGVQFYAICADVDT
ncbi:hypothetical protein [Streptomyces naphthomycinicus]|uniref:hypothetical protein n=1 Tax=Streptomyces naphthomycinicus TaxID=2872625 RepID=UPI001CEC8065|nr:hypothetical protein [Streptomyces sp. TML10]